MSGQFPVPGDQERRLARYGKLAACAAAFALAGACDEASSVDAPRTTPKSPFTIVVSGETHGFIVPCGCASRQLGGLPRRATYLESVPDRLYLDAGGSAARAFEYDRLKVGYIWRGMSGLGVAAANLGPSEIAFGRGFIEAHPDIPFVSTNVAREDGTPVVPAQRTVQIGGSKILILGICSPRYRAGSGLKVLEPAESIRGPVREGRPQFDLILLLAHAPEEELIELAEAFPELDAVLATGQSQPIVPRMIEGRTLLAGTGVKGKFLAVIPCAPSPVGGKIVEMSDALAEHPKFLDLIRDYQQAVRQADLPPEKSGEVATLLGTLPGTYRYAGSAACSVCHAEDAEIWKRSRHAHGLETLHQKGFEADPYCVRCHTTGYGGPGGYRTLSETSALGGIGCESCHGPSQAHAVAPLSHKPPVRARDACITCHDPENSPEFDFEKYWPKILHGKKR
jgi:hypothetical protein